VEVQVFGIKKSADTRKALRFFSDRRIRTHFVDLDERPAATGELKRFAQKFGIDALIDQESKTYDELGLRHARMSDDRWLEKLMDEPRLLRMPLVRQLGQQGSGRLTVGLAEKDWKQWVEQMKAR
jgi:arsenate reductase-like glutaredoxin family protein